MLFVDELLTYLIKFIALGAIAVIGVICSAKFKKNKLAKQAEAVQENVSSEQENE